MSDMVNYDDHEDNCFIDLREEIDRKTLIAIEKIVENLEKRIYTRREAVVAINAVFDSVQGLVGVEVGETLNEVLTGIQKSDKEDMFPMVFTHKGVVVILNLDLFNLSVTTSMITATGKKIDSVDHGENEPETLKIAVTKAMTIKKNGAIKL